MKYSKYNILSKVRDSEKYFIVNQLTGNVDILTPEEALKLKSLQSSDIIPDQHFFNEMVEKGYFTDEKEEAAQYRSKYLDFIDARDTDEIQLFFVPNYSCNFSCTYCYQDQYSNPNQESDFKMVDVFFSYVQSEFAGRNKYITVFGGEPLLGSTKQKELIVYLLNKARTAKLEVCFVTNGLHTC